MKDRIINIATGPYSRVLLIKARLEAEGIGSFLSNVNLLQPDVASGVKVMIHEQDMERALYIVEEVIRDVGMKKERNVEKLRSVRRILVPVDFSGPSMNAVRFAVGMAVHLKAEVRLFHTTYHPLIGTEPFTEGGGYPLNMAQVLEGMEKEAREQMKEFITGLDELPIPDEGKRPPVTYHLEQGTPDDAILMYASRYKPGVIIMGMKGRGGGIDDILGSVTYRIIRRSNIPVLVIPGKAEYRGIGQVNEVLYATDFDEQDMMAIPRLLDLVRPFGMTVHCVHISTESEDSLDRLRMDQLRMALTDQLGEESLRFSLVNHEDVLTGLDEFINNHGVDLIALIWQRKGLFERLFRPSLTRRMLFHTRIPLLVFHA
ncbi:MAG: universal stress protein [Bacteroidales bacterium]|nr:universal stress protein [Bacteroidales bacterium]